MKDPEARSSRLEQAILKLLLSEKIITPDLAVSKKLREAVLRLSDAFTRGRADLPDNYFGDKTNRLAYLAAFVLTNAAKVSACLKQVAGFLPKAGPIAVLDVGSGPGTSVFATSSLLSDRNVSFTALEKNRHALGIARELEPLLSNNHTSEWVVGDLEKVPDKQFDLAIAANVLNEHGAADQLKLCKKLLSRCKALIIIDPALKQTARTLMKLRDQLVGDGAAFVVAPCTHQKPCPMLAANQRDWCHFYLEWNRPKLIEAIDRATGLDHRYLKMSYLILRSSASHFTLHTSRSFRIVSAPRKSKGKLELVVCGNGELKRLRRLDKNASETNSDFARAARGDLVEFSEKERPGEIRALDSFKIASSLTQPSSL